MQTPVREQGSHHYLITLQIPVGQGFAIASRDGTWTPPAGATRADCYRLLREALADTDPQLATGSLLFFDIQPNRL